MTDPRRPGTDPMEAALAELAAAIEWPATPPLATSVGAAIRAGATARHGGDPHGAPWCSACWPPC